MNPSQNNSCPFYSHKNILEVFYTVFSHGVENYQDGILPFYRYLAVLTPNL
jgi:hypothetical protein